MTAVARPSAHTTAQSPNGPAAWADRLGWIFLALALVAFLGLAVPQVQRPLMYDDASFAFAARAVAERGLPFGNQGWMSERGDFSQREQWAVWHPPLYVYALGLDAKLFGASPAALRLLGLLSGLATGLLTFALAAHLAPGARPQKRLAGGVAALLALTSPLAIQSALVLDIDFTLLLPLTLAFLLLYLRLESTSRWPLLAPLFALLLWAKMTNPLAVLGCVVLWQALGGRLARAALHLIGIGLGGAALFGLTWLAVALATGMPFAMPFEVNVLQWRDSSDVARRAYASPQAFVEGLAPAVLWIGPWLVAVGVLAAVARVARPVRRWRIESVDLLLGLTLALVLGYVNKSAGWLPKYQVALVPLLAVVGATLLVSSPLSRRATSLATASGIATSAVVAAAIRDDWALSRSWSVDPAALVPLLVVLALGSVVSMLARARAVPAVLAAMALGWSLAVAAVQTGAPYSTTYWYGTLGTREAAAWVDAHLVPADTYVASKEVAFAARAQRYLDQDTLVYFLQTGRDFGPVWQGEPLRAVVLWVRDPFVADIFARELPRRGFQPGDRIGDYQVYSPAP